MGTSRRGRREQTDTDRDHPGTTHPVPILRTERVRGLEDSWGGGTSGRLEKSPGIYNPSPTPDPADISQIGTPSPGRPDGGPARRGRASEGREDS